FDISGHIENQKGIVVLEKDVNLSNFKNPGIRLGMLGDGIEVYLDDLLISEYGKKNNIIFSAFNFDKTIPLLKYKKNSNDYQLKIIIYILTNTSIRYPFYIGEYEELNFKSNIVNFFNVKVKRFLFLIIFTILIIFIYLSIKEKRKDLLYFCLSSFFILIFSLNQLVEYLPVNYITFNYLFIYKSMHLMTIFFLISFFYLVNEKMNNLVKFIIILFSLFFFIDTILLSSYNIRRKLYTYELFVGILSFIYLTFYVYLQYFYYKKLKFKKYLFPFTILFLTIVNDILVFLLPGKYPQYYIMIFGFEIYIVTISRLIFNDLIVTYLETDRKNREIEKTNEKLKGYLNNISLSLNFIQKNKVLFEESSKTLTERSKTTKSEIVLLEHNVKDLNNIINKIHDIDANIMNLSDEEIKIGNKLRNLIELNSSNFIYMKENLSITKEFSTQIEEISRQTSLLALNASIEASKSSEYSKNFAVVAAEVKNLASKSSELVNKIKDIADDISIHADLGLESTNLLSNYFEDFYFNFQAFMEILQNNKKIYKDIEDIFNEISSSINMISQTIDNLNSYADELKRKAI
ncbi:MAG: methyl-accepting chemotaxis protein, partial [Exilispira sp.]